MFDEIIRDLVKKGKRIDNRDFAQYREVRVEKGIVPNAEGSARAKIGNTEVIVGVKLDVKEPFSDNPNEGILICDANLDQETEAEIPSHKEALEVARVVDRCLRHSDFLNFGKLCIEEGKKVWAVNLDIAVINHDGNLFDAASLASILALSSAKLPKLEGESIVREEKKEPLPLNEGKVPLLISIAGIEDKLLVDPNFEEEQASDFVLTLGISEGRICAIQKRGLKGLPLSKINEILDLAFEVYSKQRESVLKFLNE